jgi:type VI protein secretion system component VasF
MSLHHPSAPQHAHSSSGDRASSRYTSLLAWPAWLRVLAILPAIVLLWLGVAWALTPPTPW